MPSVSIGVSLALTGPERVYARQLHDAVQLACDDERPLSPISLVVEDDCAESKAAARAAVRLVEAGVHAVVGPMNSWTCAAQGPIFAQARLAHITPSASNPDLTRRGWGGLFRMCPSDLDQARALAWVARAVAGARLVTAVHDGTTFARPLAAAFAAAAIKEGLDVAPACEVHTTVAASFDAAAASVARSAADAVFIAGLEEPCARAAGAIRAGSRAVFLGTDAIKPTHSLVTDGAVDGPYLTSASVNAAETAPAFHARFEARFGAHLSIYTVEAYDAVRLVAAAIRSAPTADSSHLASAIRRLGIYRGLGGDIHFDEQGERIGARLGIYGWNGSAVRFLSWYAPVTG